jgi:hypothetical protein
MFIYCRMSDFWDKFVIFSTKVWEYFDLIFPNVNSTNLDKKFGRNFQNFILKN